MPLRLLRGGVVPRWLAFWIFTMWRVPRMCLEGFRGYQDSTLLFFIFILITGFLFLNELWRWVWEPFFIRSVSLPQELENRHSRTVWNVRGNTWFWWMLWQLEPLGAQPAWGLQCRVVQGFHVRGGENGELTCLLSVCAGKSASALRTWGRWLISFTSV